MTATLLGAVCLVPLLGNHVQTNDDEIMDAGLQDGSLKVGERTLEFEYTEEHSWQTYVSVRMLHM